jgi:hypothetical protein
MVHAYLMYGYPTQTVQETIDSLEMVRQLFEQGIIQSGFWHQFAMTAHSPVGINPEEFGVIPQINDITFANNDIQFKDKTGIDHNKFSYGLKKSLYNYMHGLCFDYELQEWFDFKVPKTKVRFDFIQNCLNNHNNFSVSNTAKLLFVGNIQESKYYTKSKKGLKFEMIEINIISKINSININVDKDKGEWLIQKLSEIKLSNQKLLTFSNLKSDFENHFEDFELFWYSKPINQLRENKLLLLL